MNPAALLPHEAICPACGGDKRVMEVVPCTSSTATEPFMQSGKMIDCPLCDGVGVTIKERRDALRPAGEIDEAFRELRAAWTEQATERAKVEQALALEHALLIETQRTLKIVSERERILTRVNADQARLLDRADFHPDNLRPASSSRSPHGAVDGLEDGTGRRREAR